MTIPDDTFLGWYDADKAHTLQQRIEEAALRYRERFGVKASVCLISEEEEGAPVFIPGLSVQPKTYIRPNHYWVGRRGALAVMAGVGGE